MLLSAWQRAEMLDSLEMLDFSIRIGIRHAVHQPLYIFSKNFDIVPLQTLQSDIDYDTRYLFVNRYRVYSDEQRDKADIFALHKRFRFL